MRNLIGALLMAGACFPGASVGHDDDDDREGGEEHEGGEHARKTTPTATPAASSTATTPTAAAPTGTKADYQKECGSCHLAFPSKALPARSWQKIMGDLGNHFGDDATLGDEKRATITSWLVANAGRDRGGEAPARITEAAWFVGQHNEIPRRAVGPTAEVKSWSSCQGCHPGAARGDFEEDEVRIPGLGHWED